MPIPALASSCTSATITVARYGVGRCVVRPDFPRADGPQVFEYRKMAVAIPAARQFLGELGYETQQIGS